MKYSIRNPFNQNVGHLKLNLTGGKNGSNTIKLFITGTRATTMFHDIKTWLQENDYQLKDISDCPGGKNNGRLITTASVSRHYNRKLKGDKK